MWENLYLAMVCYDFILTENMVTSCDRHPLLVPARIPQSICHVTSHLKGRISR